MEFDKEIRRYITYTTYLHCEDPWFWEKLRYAMPHRGQTEGHFTSGNEANNRRDHNVAIVQLNAMEDAQEDFVAETAV